MKLIAILENQTLINLITLFHSTFSQIVNENQLTIFLKLADDDTYEHPLNTHQPLSRSLKYKIYLLNALSQAEINRSHIIFYETLAHLSAYQTNKFTQLIHLTLAPSPTPHKQIVFNADSTNPQPQDYTKTSITIYDKQHVNYHQLHQWVINNPQLPTPLVPQELIDQIQKNNFQGAFNHLKKLYHGKYQQCPFGYTSVLNYSNQLVNNILVNNKANYRDRCAYFSELFILCTSNYHPIFILNSILALQEIERHNLLVMLYKQIEDEFTLDYWKSPTLEKFPAAFVNSFNQQAERHTALSLANRILTNDTQAFTAMHTYANIYKELGQPNESFRIMSTYYNQFRHKMTRDSRLSFLSNLCLNSMYTDYVGIRERQEIALEYSHVLELSPEIRQLYEENQKIHISRLSKRGRDWNSQKSPIKLGYISSDFRTHPCGYMAHSLISTSDPNQFQVTLYMTQKNFSSADAIYQRFVSLQMPPHLIQIKRVPYYSLEELSKLIIKDEIDILVEMSGHTRDCRLDVLATSPAPIIISYFAYPSTTGIRAITHKITDHVCNPPQTNQFYTEKLIRLPHGFQCYSIDDDVPKLNRKLIPSTTTLPAPLRLGCFNNPSKYSPTTYRVFSQILNALPNATLQLGYSTLDQPDVINSMRNQFKQHGLINIDQVQFGKFPRTKYLDEYNRIHLALDTIPYCGGTISSEALMMSTPLVTLAGNDYVSRVGASLLSTLGYPELITTCEQHYVETVIELANQPHRLNQYSIELRKKMEATELLNPRLMQSQFSEAYRRTWVQYLKDNWHKAIPLTVEEHQPKVEPVTIVKKRTPITNFLDIICPNFSSATAPSPDHPIIKKFKEKLDPEQNEEPSIGTITVHKSATLQSLLDSPTSSAPTSLASAPSSARPLTQPKLRTTKK